MITLADWKARYNNSELAAIPLSRGSKRPVASAWQHTAPDDQWRDAGGSRFRGNIGILCGNGYGVVDCDAQETLEAARAGFDGMGLNPAYVNTPSGGQHFYIRFADTPKRFNWTPLSIGPGELRVRNAYVVAPCSTLDTRRYQWGRDTGPENVLAQPAVKWRDLQWLIAGTTPKQSALALPPVRLVWRPMPARANYLLQSLRGADKGQRIGKYATRSEAEAAVIAMLILSGWQLPEIRREFDQAMPGHYASYPTKHRRTHYLESTYRHVLNHLAATPERYELANWYHAAEFGDWPGSGGALDRGVYMALCAIGWQFSTTTPQAAQRVVAEHTAAMRANVGAAIRRLRSQALIRRLDTGSHLQAQTFEVMPFFPVQMGVEKGTTHLTANTVTIGIGLSTSAAAELWRPSALGRTAGMIYAQLGDSPRTAKELAALTGKNQRTIKRTLLGYDWRDRDGNRHHTGGMQGIGLSTKQADGYVRGNADLRALANEFECDTTAARRRRKHDDERQILSELKKAA